MKSGPTRSAQTRSARCEEHPSWEPAGRRRNERGEGSLCDFHEGGRAQTLHTFFRCRLHGSAMPPGQGNLERKVNELVEIKHGTLILNRAAQLAEFILSQRRRAQTRAAKYEERFSWGPANKRRNIGGEESLWDFHSSETSAGRIVRERTKSGFGPADKVIFFCSFGKENQTQRFGSLRRPGSTF